MISIPIIGALLEGTGTTIDRKILKNKKVNYKNYTVYGFLAIIVVMLPLIFFYWKVSPEALYLKNILIFLIVIVASVFANILSCYAIKRETVCEIEPIRMMQPLFTILIAFLLSFFFIAYRTERNVSILVLALIASVALIASHVKKHHLVFDKYIISAILGSFLFAVELAVSKDLLNYYSSFTFYFLRCIFIFLITLVIFRPRFSSIPNKIKIWVVAVAVIWVIYRVILYYGYIKYGVVFTTMLFILGPIFVYVFARIFLKEKITFRNIISAIIIVACVVAAILLNK